MRLSLSLAEFLKIIKGSSAHYLNQIFNNNPKFSWQEGYGIFSLGSKQLEKAVNYVNQQKIHHQNGTTIPSLEKTNHQDDPPRKYLANESMFAKMKRGRAEEISSVKSTHQP